MKREEGKGEGGKGAEREGETPGGNFVECGSQPTVIPKRGSPRKKCPDLFDLPPPALLRRLPTGPPLLGDQRAQSGSAGAKGRHAACIANPP